MSATEKSFFALKVATTLDRYLATANGHSQWITSLPARKKVACLRQEYDAVAVSRATVQADNPRLTIRIDGQAEDCRRRVILDSNFSLLAYSSSYHVFSDCFADRTIVVVCEDLPQAVFDLAKEKNISFVTVPRSSDGRISLSHCKTKLQAVGLERVFIEGGAVLSQSLIDARVLDYIYLFIAPKILGDCRGRVAFRCTNDLFASSPSHTVIGNDVLLEGSV